VGCALIGFFEVVGCLWTPCIGGAADLPHFGRSKVCFRAGDQYVGPAQRKSVVTRVRGMAAFAHFAPEADRQLSANSGNNGWPDLASGLGRERLVDVGTKRQILDH
jgi:hypothetical protein